LELQIGLDGRQDLVGQLYRQLRAAVLDGRLRSGDRLPPTRFLAERLGVSRKTVSEAYERLTGEGFLQARTGSGTYVADTPVASVLPHKPGAILQASPRWQALAADGQWGEQPQLRYSFTGGATDVRRFPFDEWRSCVLHALRQQARNPAAYAEALGCQPLRMAISRYLAINRAVRCDWRDILVSQGAQQALDLLARVMLEPGDLVAVEEPGYPPARQVFAAAGARVVGVPVDGEGLRVDRLPDAAKLVYVTPSHQFPLGMPLSLGRRLALLEWASARQALIVEDDYDGEYRFSGRTLEALQSLDQEGRVAYVGTFSKTLFPELRLGYLLTPTALRGHLTLAKQLADRHAETLQQLALARFIQNGAFARHTRRLLREYSQRRECLLARLQGDLAQWLEPLPALAGIHLAARLRQPRDVGRLCAELAERGVHVLDLARFHTREPQVRGLMFGFGAIETADIDPALDILAECLRSPAAATHQPD
jgi:GntR family transcriptional regulator/MocR family aminotransferase